MIPKILDDKSRVSSPESYHVSQNSKVRKKLYHPSPRLYGKLKKPFGLNHYYSEESDDQADIDSSMRFK